MRSLLSLLSSSSAGSTVNEGGWSTGGVVGGFTAGVSLEMHSLTDRFVFVFTGSVKNIQQLVRIYLLSFE